MYAWRDRVAREEDESTGFVLSRAMLLRLAERMPASAREVQVALGRSCPVALRRAEEVAEVVCRSRLQGPPPSPVRPLLHRNACLWPTCRC